MPAFTPYTPKGSPDATPARRVDAPGRRFSARARSRPARGPAGTPSGHTVTPSGYTLNSRFGGPGTRLVDARAFRPRNGIVAWLRGRRRLAIALSLCLAAGLTVHQLTPAPRNTVITLTAVRDLPVGATLAPTDLGQLHIPPELLVDGTFTEPSDLIGKQLASPVLQGQILATTQLLGQGLLAGAPKDSAAVPLRMADPASIQLLSPGQLINIVRSSEGDHGSSGGAPSEVLAEAVAVLWTPSKGDQSSEWLGSGETEGLVVVAASPSQAERLAGASSQGKLFFVMVRPGD